MLARLLVVTTLLAGCGGGPVPIGSTRRAPKPPTTPPLPTHLQGTCEWQVRDGLLRHDDTDLSVALTRTQKVDIDGIPPLDRTAWLGDCDNWDECLYAAMTRCPDGRFRAVWGPKHAWSGRDPTIEARSKAWADLVFYAKSRESGCVAILAYRHTREGDDWQVGSPCLLQGPKDPPWNDALCGDDKPPVCTP